MNPYVKVKVSNQEFTTREIKKGGQDPNFNETFTFILNSNFVPKGRHIEVTVYDKNITADSIVGTGSIDLDPIIHGKQHLVPTRIFMNYKTQAVGHVNTVIDFIEEDAETVSFRFENASIRRKTSSITSPKVWIKVFMGEEVLFTQKDADKKNAPSWSDEVLSFNIPKSMMRCRIICFDDEKEIGEFDVSIPELLATDKEQRFSEDLKYKNEVAGSIRFSTIKGNNPVFSELKQDYEHVHYPASKMDVKPEGQLADNPNAVNAPIETKPVGNSEMTHVHTSVPEGQKVEQV